MEPMEPERRLELDIGLICSTPSPERLAPSSSFALAFDPPLRSTFPHRNGSSDSALDSDSLALCENLSSFFASASPPRGPKGKKEKRELKLLFLAAATERSR